jgi:hypothetical protein
MTPLRIIQLVEPFLPAFAQGALAFAEAHGTKPERVSLLAGLCLRESWACTAPGYRPKGDPSGSGDWLVRTGHWTREPGVIVHADTPGARAALWSAGWSIPKREGSEEPVPGPYATPKDGRGWGRGLLQADILGDFHDLIPAPGTPWPVERQAFKTCAHLDMARRQLAEFAKHPLFERACRARYNASLARVVTGMENAITKAAPDELDRVTTGRDYSRDIRALEAAVVARWPDTGLDLPVPTRSNA